MLMLFKVSDPTSRVRLGLLRRFGFGEFREAVGCELPEDAVATRFPDMVLFGGLTLLFVCGGGLSPLAFWDNLLQFSALVDDFLLLGMTCLFLNPQRTRFTFRFFGC